MRLKSEFHEDRYQKPTYETFEVVYPLWFESVYVGEVKESTAVKTKELFKNHILNDLGKMRIATITFAHCQEAVNKWSKKTMKTETMVGLLQKEALSTPSTHYGSLSTILWMRWTFLSKKTSKEDYAFYNREELELFLEYAKQEENPKWYVLFRLLAFSGMRKGEALDLQWWDINFEDKTISINKTLARGEDNKFIIQTTKTTAGERTISVDDKTQTMTYKSAFKLFEVRNEHEQT